MQTTPVLLAGGTDRDTARKIYNPLSIYVLWHPDFPHGPKLARHLYDWLGGATSDSRGVGLGIPVHFRSRDWDPDLDLGGVQVSSDPPPHAADARDELERERAERASATRKPVWIPHALHNVFVPLVDDHMVEDPSWRRDLVEIAQARARDAAGYDDASSRVHLLPVQITPAWTRLPPAVADVQPIFLSRWTDPDESGEELLARWKPRLTRLFTQALVKLLRDRAGSVLPSSVFLSHAKADGLLGPGVAERLRDAAAGYGQIEVFYDENGLPTGYGWSSRLQSAAGESAGFVAILSDRYSSRYWCRREVEIARTPRRASIPDGQAPTGRREVPNVWNLSPSVVAVTMDATWTRFISDLSSVPAVAWREGREELVLDQLFREALISEYQRLYALQLSRSLSRTNGIVGQHTDFVTWTPDPASLLRLHQERIIDWDDDQILSLVVYPGHGLLPTEEQALHLLFRHPLGQGGTRKVVFMSYERLVDLLYAGVPITEEAIRNHLRDEDSRRAAPDFGAWPRFALSAGDADDLDVLGYEQPELGHESVHLDAAVFRLVRALLHERIRVVYGGGLRASASSFQSLLTDIAASTFVVRPPHHGEERPQELPSDPDPDTPLENYLSWPLNQRTTTRDRAANAGLCRYYDIREPDHGTAPNTPADEFSADVSSWRTARALSSMRLKVAARAHVTLAIAGRKTMFKGIMPGVAEEFLCAVELAAGLDPDGLLAGTIDEDEHTAAMEGLDGRDLPVLLVGGFGGITRQLARYVFGVAPELQPWFLLEKQLDDPSNHHLTLALQGAERDSEWGQKWVARRYRDLGSALDRVRRILAELDDEPMARLGLTREDWKILAKTESPGHIRRLLVSGPIASAHTRFP